MKKDFLFSAIFFLVITLFFFYPVFKGHIPFPGDLLVSLAPYSSEAYFGYAPGGVPNLAQGSDVIREAYPWKYSVIEALKSGQLPFWQVNNFSGNPLLANFQSAVFSPFNIILFLQPFYFAWAIFILISPFLAAFFNYLFLRELKLSKTASIFGGIVFAFCSYMVVWIEYGNITHTLLWLPLVLLFTERLVHQFSRRNLLFLLLYLSGSLLSGYIQGFFYVVLVAATFFFFKSYVNKKLTVKKSLSFVGVLAAPVCLFLFQLLTTYFLLSNSSRGAYSIEQIQNLLNPLWYAVTVVIPNFFGHPAARNFWFDGTYIERVSYFGLIPLILALSAAQVFKKNVDVKIFAFLFCLTFIISLDLLFTKYIYTLPIPMLTTSVPTRILGIFQFCGSILAAFGLEYFLQKKEKRTFIISSIIVGGIGILAFIFTFIAPKIFISSDWINHLDISKRNTVIPLLLIVAFVCLFLIRRFSARFSAYAIILVTVLELFYFFHKITPFSPKEYIYPDTPVITYLKEHAGYSRFWGYGSAYISSNFQLVDKTFSPEGEDPLHIKNYTELLETSENGKFPNTLPRPDANVANGFGEEDLERNTFRQKILNLTGVKYVLNKNDGLGQEYRHDTVTFKDNKYKLVWQEAPWQIYENLQVVPRVFLTNDYIVLNDKEKFLATFYAKNFDEKKTLILQEKPAVDVANFSKGTVKLVNYQDNKIILQSTADAPALLFISDTYYPDWQAKVDGQDTKVMVADYAFRSIVVPEGEHKVEFYYDSKMFKIGIFLSSLTAIVLILFFIRFKKIN